MRIYFILKLNILKHIFKGKKNVQVRKRDVYLSISCLVFILSNFYQIFKKIAQMHTGVCRIWPGLYGAEWSNSIGVAWPVERALQAL